MFSLTRELPFMHRLPVDQVIEPRIHPARATALVFGAASRVSPLAPEIVTEYPGIDISILRLLRQSAVATWVTHLAVVEPGTRDMEVEVNDLHSLLLACAESLVVRGWFDQATIDGMQFQSRVVERAKDLVRLASMFEQLWSDIRPFHVLSRADIEQATEVGLRFLSGEYRELLEKPHFSLDLRNRAFTQLFQRYQRVRRIIYYVRYEEEDAPLLCPSLVATTREYGGPDAPFRGADKEYAGVEIDPKDNEPTFGGFGGLC